MGSGDPFLEGVSDGTVFGTLWHGALECDGFRRAWLSQAATLAGVGDFVPGETSFAAAREHRIDRLADAVETHLDLDALQAVAERGAPEMPTLELALR